MADRNVPGSLPSMINDTDTSLEAIEPSPKAFKDAMVSLASLASSHQTEVQRATRLKFLTPSLEPHVERLDALEDFDPDDSGVVPSNEDDSDSG